MDQSKKVVTLKVDHLTKTYEDSAGNKQTVFRGLSVSFESGTMYAIFGPSGSGKSTFLNLAGLLDHPDRPSGGSICLGGKDVPQLDPEALAALRRDYIGFVHQDHYLVEDLTVEKNLEFAMWPNRSIPKKDYRERSKQLLSRFGMEEYVNRYPRELSGGEQQRVCIARALVNDPSIILADEPTGNLDEDHGREVLSCLKGLAEQGKTVIIVTHSNIVKEYADVIYELKRGELRKLDREEELKKLEIAREKGQAEENIKKSEEESGTEGKGEEEERDELSEQEKQRENEEDNINRRLKILEYERKRKRKKALITAAIAVVCFCVLLVPLHILIVFMTYEREDSEGWLLYSHNPAHESHGYDILPCGEIYTVMTYNLGGGISGPDSRNTFAGSALVSSGSKDTANYADHMEEIINKENPDFALLQETDSDTARCGCVEILSGFLDLTDDFGEIKYDAVMEQYYSFPLNGVINEFLPGNNWVNLVNLTHFYPHEGEQIMLPASDGIRKLIDPDWRYLITRYDIETKEESDSAGSETSGEDTKPQLVLINVHLATYASGSSLVEEQWEALCERMTEEYEAGNYVIVGGDFGQDMAGISDELYGNTYSKSWMKVFDSENIPEGYHLALQDLPEDEISVLPATYRDSSKAYTADSAVWVTDTFLYSDNITMLDYETVDTEFAWSDHNPVVMKFTLNAAD